MKTAIITEKPSVAREKSQQLFDFLPTFVARQNSAIETVPVRTYTGKTVKQTKQDRDKTKGTSVSRYIAFSVVF